MLPAKRDERFLITPKPSSRTDLSFQVQVILGAMSTVVKTQPELEPIDSSAANQVPDLPDTINAIARMHLEKCGLEESQGLVKTHLSDRSVTCNDGSPSG